MYPPKVSNGERNYIKGYLYEKDPHNAIKSVELSKLQEKMNSKEEFSEKIKTYKEFKRTQSTE